MLQHRIVIFLCCSSTVGGVCEEVKYLFNSNRTAEQLQDQRAESGVDYASSRIQESEGNIGEYATYGMERMGRWRMECA